MADHQSLVLTLAKYETLSQEIGMPVEVLSAPVWRISKRQVAQRRRERAALALLPETLMGLDEAGFGQCADDRCTQLLCVIAMRIRALLEG